MEISLLELQTFHEFTDVLAVIGLSVYLQREREIHIYISG